MLRTYRTCNPIVGSSKNEFNNKLLGDVILVKVTLSQFIYIYIEREREREREFWIQVTLDITLSNVTPPNNLLLNSYFENLTVALHVLYVFDMHANFYTN